MKKTVMLILFAVLLVLTLVGTPVLAKEPDKGASGVPFQEIWDAIDEAVSTLQGQIDEVVSDLDQLIGDIDSIVQGKVDEAIAVLSIDWSQITGIPSDLADGDDVGIAIETDPTVVASVKDGVDWAELSGVPAGFADNVDDVGVTSLPSTVMEEGENVSLLNNDAGYLTSYTETDPTVAASVKDGVDWTELSNIPADIADGDQVGIATEVDPTVLASVKDGVDWAELSGIPAGFADGVDDVGGAGTAPSLNPLQVALLRWYEANEAGNFFSVGDGPRGICFDGANIWVANHSDDTVTKLKASDGSTVGTYSVGDYPRDICFDGANSWVTNQASYTVSKL